MIDAGLLGELTLRHLLGLELGSKPFVERSSVLGRHVVEGAPSDRPGRLAGVVPRWLHYRLGRSTPVSPVGTDGPLVQEHDPPVGVVGSCRVAGGWGRSVTQYQSTGAIPAREGHVERFRPRTQTEGTMASVGIGSPMCSRPRGLADVA